MWKVNLFAILFLSDNFAPIGEKLHDNNINIYMQFQLE